MEINGKWLIIQGVKTNYCPASNAFLAIFEGPRKKRLMPHSQISFKSWFENVDSDFEKRFVKLMLLSLEKKNSFSNGFCFSSTLDKFDCQNSREFSSIFKSLQSKFENVESEL